MSGHDCSGCDDNIMLINHKYYFDLNITAVDVCSTQCLVLVLGTRAT